MRIMREVDGTGVELRLRKRLGRRSTGEIIELDANGFVVSSIKILPGIGIIGLFCHVVQKVRPLSILKDDDDTMLEIRLSLHLRNGDVVLMNPSETTRTIIHTGLIDGRMSWSQDGCFLAVAGLRKSHEMSATVKFFRPSRTSQLIQTLSLNTKDQVTAVTWAHNDTKLFVATGSVLHTVNLQRGIPTLQQLSKSVIAANITSREACYDLILPTRIKFYIADSFTSIIKGHIPKENNILEYVSHPPPYSHRIYCTLIPSNSPWQYHIHYM
jgi:WD40 repeat protein